MKMILAGAFCLMLCGNSHAQKPTDGVWVDQLVGRWEGPLGNMTYVEEWTKLDANNYEGIATTKKGDQVVATEYMRITMFSGHWLYLANPGGQGVSCFVRVSADETTWIFENKEHDFPKRIGYAIKGAGLGAWLAGDTDTDKRMDFALKRID